MIGLIFVLAGLIGLALLFPWLWLVYLVFIGMAVIEFWA